MREMRKTLGLSQQELADVLGVNRVSVARWETGERTPSRMAQFFLQHLLRCESGGKDHGEKKG